MLSAKGIALEFLHVETIFPCTIAATIGFKLVKGVLFLLLGQLQIVRDAHSFEVKPGMGPANAPGVVAKASLFKSPADNGHIVRQRTDAFLKSSNGKEQIIYRISRKFFSCRSTEHVSLAPKGKGARHIMVTLGLGQNVRRTRLTAAEDEQGGLVLRC